MGGIRINQNGKVNRRYKKVMRWGRRGGGGDRALRKLLKRLCVCGGESKKRLSFSGQAKRKGCCVCPIRIRTLNLFSSGQMSQGALPNFSHGTLGFFGLES